MSLATVKLASLPATDRHSFGWHHAEVSASFINGVTVLLIALVIFHEAWQRFSLSQEVKSLPMLIIAAVGLVANPLYAAALHGRSHNDQNVRNAFLHLAGDAGASIGVIIGGAIMYFTHWYLLAAVISIGISIIFIGAGRVLQKSVHILMEGVPGGTDIAEITDTIRHIEGVKDRSTPSKSKTPLSDCLCGIRHCCLVGSSIAQELRYYLKPGQIEMLVEGKHPFNLVFTHQGKGNAICIAYHLVCVFNEKT